MISLLDLSAQKEFVLVKYPGKVINVENMIGTLGGITKISQAFGAEQKQLELRYHHKNPFNKPIYADRATDIAGLLLSIKIRRSKKDRTKPPQYEVRVLGYCRKWYFFNNLCDFQYLPLHKSKETESSEQEFILDALIPKSVTDIEYFNRTEVPLFSIPIVFARSDSLHSGLFRNVAQEDGQHGTLGLVRKSNYEYRDAVTFNMIDSFPTRPDAQIVKRMKIKYVSDEQLQCVRKLFEECPIWTRRALLYESGITHEKLKCIISSLAYYFSTGPWRTLYVRYGYDPRKDFNSRHYQTFDFRIRFRAGVAKFVANRKDSLRKSQSELGELGEITQDINYPFFEENKLPPSRQCILRYSDIHMPKIQEMLGKIPSPLTGAMCNERTGWLPAGFDAQVRQIVSNAVKDLLRNHYRKEQIHAELDAVENEAQLEGDDENENENEEDDSDSSATNEFLADNIAQVLDDDMQVDD